MPAITTCFPVPSHKASCPLCPHTHSTASCSSAVLNNWAGWPVAVSLSLTFCWHQVNPSSDTETPCKHGRDSQSLFEHHSSKAAAIQVSGALRFTPRLVWQEWSKMSYWGPQHRQTGQPRSWHTRDISCLASLLQLSISRFTAPVQSCNHVEM